MEITNENIDEILQYIDPSALDYSEWTKVGMGLKSGGIDCSKWDAWSQNDSRYHEGECYEKWETFSVGKGTEEVTIGTVVDMAKKNGLKWGFSSKENFALSWDMTEIVDYTIIEDGYVQPEVVPPCRNFNPCNQLIEYLETLFDNDDIVGYVNTALEQKQANGKSKFTPVGKGHYTRTVGELITELLKTNDITNVIGTYNPNAGCWIRFNPLNGSGVKNENVAEYKYCLVESDTLPIEEQYGIIKELQLPVAVLVHSGGKSLHAIVRVDAINSHDYKNKVKFIYDVCKKNGLQIDEQNKNPSRLSRMPGVERGKKKQYIVAKNIGQASYSEWEDYIKSLVDDLPDIEVADLFTLPQREPEIIEGMLRRGRKMLVAGASKAGKSFLLMNLCLCVATGSQWLGYNVRQGKALYVNFELGADECATRFINIANSMNIDKAQAQENLHIWNMRGHACELALLTDKLIRKASKEKYDVVVIDPIYKILMGDENNASDMGKFCNEFDKIAENLKCSVIFCHHHSKGSQGGKASIDRSSGSGVFARDPDAILDMMQIDPHDVDPNGDYSNKTLWRIEITLREFRSPDPIEIWFDYPRHTLAEGFSEADEIRSTDPVVNSKRGNRKKQAEKEKKKLNLYNSVVEYYSFNGEHPTVNYLAEHLQSTEKTIRRWVEESDELVATNGKVYIQDN